MKDTDTVFATVKVYMLGNTPAMYFERWWGFERGAKVNVRFYRFRDNTSKNHVVDLGEKRVCAIGGGLGIYIGVNKGVGKGDAIVAKISGVVHGDTGNKTEEGFKSALE